jgi:uncharacterized phage protein gp47/JayE
MPYTRPTLPEIIARIEADMSSRLLDGAPVLRRSFLGVLSRVFGGMMHMLYGFLIWISRQIVPGPDNDPEYLEQHSDDYGVTRRAAAFAGGIIDITGTDGSIVPAGTVMQRADAVQYEVTEDSDPIAAGVGTVTVEAVVAGIAGDALDDTVVSFVSPVDGVDQAAAVASTEISGGVDAETDEDLLARLQEKMQNAPQGGALIDYSIWAKEIAGVGEAYPFALYDSTGDVYPAPGCVGVAIMGSDGYPASGAIVAAVQAHFDDDETVPATAVATAYAPESVAVDFHIHLAPNTTSVQDVVYAEIEALLFREGVPNSTVLLSHIDEVISTATGETDHLLVTPSASIVLSRKQVAVIGTVTFGAM